MSDVNLEHAQAAFMEWIKIVEFDLGTADTHFYAAENALRAENLEAFGNSFGLAHGHLQNALKTIRSATQQGFETGNITEPI